MASAKKAIKTSFVNRKAEIVGASGIRALVEQLRDEADGTLDEAKNALQSGDRKGVLLAMKTGDIIGRAANSLEKALARAQRVRLTREEKLAWETNQVLPEGYEVAVVGADEDDDTEDDEI